MTIGNPRGGSPRPARHAPTRRVSHVARVDRKGIFQSADETRHITSSREIAMGSTSNGGSSSRTDAKEYARFCRIHGLFLVDGLETWRTALTARGLSEVEIGA